MRLLTLGFEMGSSAELSSLAAGGAGWYLAAKGFKCLPAFIRRAAWYIPIYLAAIALFGLWYEIRLFTPLLPILVPAFLIGLRKGVNHADTSNLSR